MSAQSNIVMRGLRGLVSSSLGRLIIFKILCLALVVGGIAVGVMSLSGAYQALIHYVPDSTILRIVLAVIAVAAGIVGLLPVPRSYRGDRVISYPGERGTVTINLDSVEGSLTRALGQLREVKKVMRLDVVPTNEQKVSVKAEIIPNKEPAISMRELGYRLSDRIAEIAERILGDNEVATVDVSFPRLADTGADVAPAHMTQPSVSSGQKSAPAVQKEAPVEEPVEEPSEEEEEWRAAEAAEEETLEPEEPADEDDLIPGAGSAASTDEEAESEMDESPSNLDLEVDLETPEALEAEPPELAESETAEEPAWAEPLPSVEGNEEASSEPVTDAREQSEEESEAETEQETEEGRSGW